MTEFFQKAGEHFQGSSLRIDSIVVGLDHVVSEWTLHIGLKELFYAGLSRDVQILLHGVSVVRTRNGEIVKWSDYYDGPTQRRTALAAHFTDWGEL